MNLNQLEYFVSVAEKLNFTKAAEQCFISQTAMTQQIHALERTVGVPLLVRDKHHVELTAAGKVYLNEARAILARSNEALRLARMASTGIEGSLTIGFIRGYGQSDFPSVLRKFHVTYPNISITLVSGNMSELNQMLEKGKCDMIFTVQNILHETEAIYSQYVQSFPLMVALYPGHPLAERETLTYADLREEDFIMMQPVGRPKDEMEESMLVYEKGGFFPKIVALEGLPETLFLMISVGMGISILPEYVTHLHQKRSDLKIIPLVKSNEEMETINIEAHWPKINANPAVTQMLEILREY